VFFTIKSAQRLADPRQPQNLLPTNGSRELPRLN
jgi:hypothetical protein